MSSNYTKNYLQAFLFMMLYTIIVLLQKNTSTFEFQDNIVAELSGQELEQWRDIVEQMQVAADLFNSIVEHPFTRD